MSLLENVRARSLSLLVAGTMLYLPVSAFAAVDKEAAYAEMQALGSRLDAAKASPADASADFARYRELSALLGGDDPAGLLHTSDAPAAPGHPGAMGPKGTNPAGCTVATPVFQNTTPTAIPTGPAVVTSTIVVAGAGSSILDVDLATFIIHSFAADLDITLTSPAGTIVTLTTDNGAGSDNVFNGTVWDDDANPAGQVPYVNNNGVTTDHLYVNLTTATPLAPEEPLSAFAGENPNGTWTITISDDLAGDGGSLDAWALGFTTIATAPTLAAGVFDNTTPVAIPTGPAVVSSTITVPAGASIFKVRVNTIITHTFAADLDITLRSPSGTVVTLTTDNGAGSDNVFNGTIWDDDANPGGQVPYVNNNGVATDHLYVNLTLASPLTPEEPLGAFLGEDAAGVWTLTISDDLAGDGGNLVAWALEITRGTCAVATVAPAALAVDAAGNGVMQPNETVTVAPSWQNTSTVAIANLTGTLGTFTGPAGATYTVNDGAAIYGALAAGATAQCSNCYAATATAATRPITHWDTTAVEAVSTGPTNKTWTLHIGNSFTDVTPSNPFFRFVETILHKGVTTGCGTGVYCPSASTTREQMAVFVLVAREPAGFNPPACIAGSEVFSDVPASSPFCRWVEELVRRGVVSGCGNGQYCALNPAARDAMAVFVLRTLLSTLDPPPCVAGSEMFADLPASSPFCRWVEELVRRGVVTGCGNGNYCPLVAVTREQMSVFLTVTFGLTLYGL